MIGTKLGHYQITRHLGSGGMGDVYQATDTKLGRSVAIKFLPEAFSHDTERVGRFQREARVLASLNHPNIAGLEEVESPPLPGYGVGSWRLLDILGVFSGQLIAAYPPRMPQAQ